VTRYTVGWRDKALQQLAQIWNGATDRVAVTRASDRIDRELATDPDHKGRITSAIGSSASPRCGPFTVSTPTTGGWRFWKLVTQV
jgi:hypothetical protein